MAARVLISFAACFALMASSASAKNLTLPVEGYTGEEMAAYKIKVNMPKGWKSESSDPYAQMTFSRKLSKKCLAVMVLRTAETFDYDSLEPNPQGFMDSVIEGASQEGAKLSGQGELTNQEQSPGGVAFLSSGRWALFGLTASGKPAFSGVALYYEANRFEDRLFRVASFEAAVSQNMGFGGTSCKRSQLRPLSKVVSQITRSAQVVS